MKVSELIDYLSKCDPDAAVYIPDQWYGEEGTTSKVEIVRDYPAIPECWVEAKVELGFIV